LKRTQSARAQPERIRLLALDIDDTLTGSDGRMSQANLEAVAWAAARGVAATLVTGRRYLNSAQRFAAALDLSGPIGCHYGRALVVHPDGEFLAQHHLPPDISARAVEIARRRNLGISLCADETLYFRERTSPASVVPDEWRALPRTKVVPDLDDVLVTHGERVMSLTLSGCTAADLRALFAADVELGRVSIYDQRATGRGESLVVMLAGGEDKGTALRQICSRLGIAPAEVVAMGDSEADVSLLLAAGYGIAMPWAADSVRSAADQIAQGSPDNAVAREVYRLLG